MESTQDKYAKVPWTIKGYPSPEPAKDRKSDIFDIKDYTLIDERVKSITGEQLKDFPTLVGHISEDLDVDLDIVRAIYSWLGAQRVMQTSYPADTEQNTPTDYLGRIKDRPARVYAVMFAIMCRKAGIPCVILNGHMKAAAYDIGDKSTPTGTWNAVYIAGGWRLVHCHWSFMSLVGHSKEGWAKIEHDEKKMYEETSGKSGQLEDTINEDYFLTDPEVFNYKCLATDPKWQLLPVPHSMKLFLKLPLIQPDFIQEGFTFKRGQLGTLKLKTNNVNVTIVSKLNNQLRYTLFYKTQKSRRFPDTKDANRYVLMENVNQDSEIKFTVMNLPIKGKYKLELSTSIGSVVCTFRIIVKQAVTNFIPPPKTEIDWGPGPAAEAAGLTQLSHTGGIIAANRDENIVVNFRTSPGQRVTARLRSETIPESMTREYITTSVFKGHVKISVRPVEGEYALLINAGEPGANAARNVLNYLIHAGNVRKADTRQNATEQKLMCKHLTEAVASGQKEDLRKYLDKFLRLGVRNKTVLTSARQSLKTMELKDRLKFAIMRRRVDELQKSIEQAKKSDVLERVQSDVVKAEKVLKTLRHRQTTPRQLSGINRATVAELRAIRSLTLPLHEVFIALYLLLGEVHWMLQDTDYILRLLKQSDDGGLLERLGRSDITSLNPRTVKEAEELLKKYDKEQIAKICPAAEKVHQAGLKLVNKFHKQRSIRSISEESNVYES